MKRHRVMIGATLCMTAGLLAACGRSHRSGDESAITGRVREIPGQPEDGAKVTAYRVEADGSLLNVSKDSVRSKRGGGFRVVVDETYIGEGEFLVQAERNGVTGRVLVAERIEEKDESIVAPIDRETNMEADAFIQARSQSWWDDSLSSQALMRFFVTPQSTSSPEVNAAQVGKGATAAMYSWLRLLSKELKLSDDKINQLRDAITDAQMHFDATVDGATRLDLEDEARSEFANQLLSAHEDAGIEGPHVAVAVDAAAYSMLAIANDMPGPVRKGLLVNSEEMRSRMIRGTVEDAFRSIEGNAGQVQGVTNAGQTLIDGLQNAYDSHEASSKAIRSAWENYQGTVRAQLDAIMAELGGAIQAKYNLNVMAVEGAGGLLSVFSGALDAVSPAVDADDFAKAVAKAHGAFYMGVVADSRVRSLKDAGMSDAGARAVLRILALTEMAPL